MAQTSSEVKVAGRPAEAITVQLFDPPMCCSTGLCGPTVDQTLVDVNEMVMALQAEGVRMERYQLTTHPQTFLGNPDVIRLLREHTVEALPITVVRGKVLKYGAYPTMSEIKESLNGE